MIQYSIVEELYDNNFKIEVLGGYDHKQEHLERAVLKKASTLCKGDAKIEKVKWAHITLEELLEESLFQEIRRRSFQ